MYFLDIRSERIGTYIKREKYTNGIKIYSLTIDKIVYLLENNINYKYFLNRVFENYIKIEFIGNNIRGITL